MPRGYKTNLSKWLDKLLKPFIPCHYNLKDSFDFVDKLQAFNSKASKSIMASFDVKSLFTNVPVALTIQHILSLVDEASIPITKSTLERLLFLACSNVLFSFDNNLYIQKDGVCMGSPIGPTMAAFAMDMIESKINTFDVKPIMYQRYVDDIFALFHSVEEARQFLKTLNSCSLQLQFTLELESNCHLSFLDVDIFRRGHDFVTGWHCKQTNTGRYIPVISYSPPKYQAAACRTLLYRARRICSSQDLYLKARNTIRSMFLNNGYNDSWFLRIEGKIVDNAFKRGSSHIVGGVEPVKRVFWRVPYIRDQYSYFARSLNKINSSLPRDVRIIPVYDTKKSLNMLPNKDPVPTGLASNVVYKFQCEHCEMCYIGETTRHLVTRIKEHIGGKPNPTEIFTHGHSTSEAAFKVIGRSQYTKIAEALHIRAADRNFLLNKQGTSLPLFLYS